MRLSRRVIVVALAALLQMQSALAQSGAALAADQPLLTDGGSELTGAQGWTVRRAPAMLMVDAPENDATLALVELAAPNAAAAIEAAWARYRPDSRRVPNMIRPSAARDGWDERVVAHYETSPGERMVVDTIALRSGAKWTVVILEGAQSTVQKRGAAVELMLGTVRPQGYKPETFAGRKAHRLDAARIATLRAFLAESMKQLRIPGAALALVENGKIIHESGIGVREFGKPAAVNAHTLFMAASNTKSMTTLLLATLADEGKLQWDKPVVDLYPAFRLGDAAVTSKVLFKHLVCACTGLPRQDLEMMFEFGGATAQSSIALLGGVTPTSNFGELYQYSNLMASAAGYIGASLVYPGMEQGRGYDRAMRERIFKPLGMRSTTFDMARALRGNHARPHTVDFDNKLRVADIALDRSIVPHRPAGGAWTSAHDMIRYVQLEANEGKLANGKQLVTRANLLARRQPQVAEGEGVYYGMGLEMEKAWGVDIVTHGGSLPGFKSNFYLLPESGVGAVLLTNADDALSLLRPFLRRLVEVLYDGKPEAVEDVAIAAANMKAYRVKARATYTVPADPVVAAGLAKRYRNKDLGELAISRKGSATYIDAGEWKSRIATRKNEDGSFSLLTTTPGLDNFEFSVDKRDGKRALIVRDGQHEYIFAEQP
jgi:CubicO group peptidase (beta-lactamase class C family)